ncbi:hypothetical protein [Streptomyces albidoflavus]|uniref:hypothetical protein n=1 Tax=Streptomyces albidoflavus TaxID=1886 RepID=UPI002257A2C9|nr:hypothetical protein [Streptomyces albidoflavus]MCX4444744.1 hypothetical protein [Streptomyces albidoflavus]
MSLVTWHRPDFEGREDELVNQNAIAELAGVTRAAVSNWTSRDPAFPAVVAIQGNYGRAPRLYVLAEVQAWLSERSSRPRSKPARRTPARPRYEILTARAERAKHRIADEEQRMASLYVELGKAAERLKRAQDELAAITAEAEETPKPRHSMAETLHGQSSRSS